MVSSNVEAEFYDVEGNVVKETLEWCSKEKTDGRKYVPFFPSCQFWGCAVLTFGRYFVVKKPSKAFKAWKSISFVYRGRHVSLHIERSAHRDNKPLGEFFQITDASSEELRLLRLNALPEASQRLLVSRCYNDSWPEIFKHAFNKDKGRFTDAMEDRFDPNLTYGGIFACYIQLIFLDDKENLLSVALLAGDEDIISTIIEAGAELSRRNRYGETPIFFFAAGNSNPQLLSLLESKGAKLDVWNKYHESPYFNATGTNFRSFFPFHLRKICFVSHIHPAAYLTSL